MNETESKQFEEKKELQIQVPSEVQGGKYANQMIITHTQEEFVLDFILATPPLAVVNARVLVSPSHAKRIVSLLQENIANYESLFGEIKRTIPVGKPDHIQTH